jgi:hypothetical protein
MTTFFIPEQYREPDTDRVAATQILGCDDTALTALVHSGLPVENDRFDSRDLFNLGLHSGTGTTVPEQAFAFSLRWMRGTTESLLAPRASRFELALTCPECEHPVSTLARPRPERYGGAVSDLTPAAADNDNDDDDDDLVAGPTLTATVHTRGELAPLDSPVLREVVRDFAGLGLRWVKLPAALREDEDLVTSHGVASCESASRYLARRVTDAGLAATTRIGWVIGMLDLVHAWVEVTDTDGTTKVLDPIFALFATTVRDANPLLTEPTMSLRTNRLIPTGLPVGGQVATHDCAGQGFRLSTKIQPAREAR